MSCCDLSNIDIPCISWIDTTWRLKTGRVHIMEMVGLTQSQLLLRSLGSLLSSTGGGLLVTLEGVLAVVGRQQLQILSGVLVLCGICDGLRQLLLLRLGAGRVQQFLALHPLGEGVGHQFGIAGRAGPGGLEGGGCGAEEGGCLILVLQLGADDGGVGVGGEDCCFGLEVVCLRVLVAKVVVLGRGGEVEVLPVPGCLRCQVHQLGLGCDRLVVVMSDKEQIIVGGVLLEIVQEVDLGQVDLSVGAGALQLALQPIVPVVELVLREQIGDGDARVLGVAGQLQHDVGGHPRHRTNDKQAHVIVNNIIDNIRMHLTPPRSVSPRLPLVTCFLLGSLLVARVVDWATAGWIQQNLVLAPEPIVRGYQFWRLLTFWLYEPSFVTLLLIFDSSWGFFSQFELKNSSVILFNDITAELYLFMAVFFFPQLTLYYFYPDISTFTVTFTMIWLNFTYKYCHYNPDTRVQICHLALPLSLKYYPFVMCAIFMAANLPEIRLDGLFGLSLAVIECWCFNGGLMLFPKCEYERKEGFADCLGLTKLQNWQNLVPDRVVENHRMTVNSSQFYEGLGDFRPEFEPAPEGDARSLADFKNGQSCRIDSIQI